MFNKCPDALFSITHFIILTSDINFILKKSNYHCIKIEKFINFRTIFSNKFTLRRGRDGVLHSKGVGTREIYSNFQFLLMSCLSLVQLLVFLYSPFILKINLSSSIPNYIFIFTNNSNIVIEQHHNFIWAWHSMTIYISSTLVS
jgi:hypothetical protein